MSKKFIRQDVNDLKVRIKTTYANKYYNMFMHEFEWTGLESEQIDYIMRQFWSLGSVAAFKIKNTEDLGFCQFTTQTYNMYDFPETVQLINKWQVPFIPMGQQTVNKDVVLGWIQSNHKGIKAIVDYYIDRMVQVDMVINTNLNVHKLPMLVTITPNDKEKAKDVVDRILNDELVVFVDSDQVNTINQVVSEAPYIIDKLYQYKTNIENELLTYLGLDNNCINTKEQVLVDQINANNQVINANKEAMLDCLKSFTDQMSEFLGVTVTVEAKQQVVDSVYDENQEGEPEDGMEDSRD